MNAHKLFFPKSKTKSHIILLKKICNTAKKLLKPPYIKDTKTTILLAAHQKQQLL